MKINWRFWRSAVVPVVEPAVDQEAINAAAAVAGLAMYVAAGSLLAGLELDTAEFLYARTGSPTAKRVINLGNKGKRVPPALSCWRSIETTWMELGQRNDQTLSG
jgi:hypothetical protein